MALVEYDPKLRLRRVNKNQECHQVGVYVKIREIGTQAWELAMHFLLSEL